MFHCAASDASGNTNFCVFTVAVLGARGVKQNVLAGLIALRATVPCDEGSTASDKVCAKLNDCDPAFTNIFEPGILD